MQSKPLQTIVAAMDRDSDNFIAEMLLKDIGAEVGARRHDRRPARPSCRRDLAAAHVPLAGVRIVDGSGLSLLDRLTASAIAALLLDAWNDPELRGPFWHALPVAGETGTLEDRMERAPARGVVRAKTGTTNEASALSGFVSDRYVFAVLQNGSPVSRTRRARRRIASRPR